MIRPTRSEWTIWPSQTPQTPRLPPAGTALKSDYPAASGSPGPAGRRPSSGRAPLRFIRALSASDAIRLRRRAAAVHVGGSCTFYLTPDFGLQAGFGYLKSAMTGASDFRLESFREALATRQASWSGSGEITAVPLFLNVTARIGGKAVRARVSGGIALFLNAFLAGGPAGIEAVEQVWKTGGGNPPAPVLADEKLDVLQVPISVAGHDLDRARGERRRRGRRSPSPRTTALSARSPLLSLPGEDLRLGLGDRRLRRTRRPDRRLEFHRGRGPGGRTKDLDPEGRSLVLRDFGRSPLLFPGSAPGLTWPRSGRCHRGSPTPRGCAAMLAKQCHPERSEGSPFGGEEIAAFPRVARNDGSCAIISWENERESHHAQKERFFYGFSDGPPSSRLRRRPRRGADQDQGVGRAGQHPSEALDRERHHPPVPSGRNPRGGPSGRRVVSGQARARRERRDIGLRAPEPGDAARGRPGAGDPLPALGAAAEAGSRPSSRQSSGPRVWKPETPAQTEEIPSTRAATAGSACSCSEG